MASAPGPTLNTPWVLVVFAAMNNTLHAIAVALLALCASTPAQVTPSPPAKWLQTLQAAEYKFTPEVKAGFLAFRRAEALAELQAHGFTLPADFLAWVDSTPLAASTLYGIRNGSPAQALFVLRSLELDLGEEVLRSRHPQLGLAAAWGYADSIQFKEKKFNSFRLDPRGRFQVAIPPDPRVKVDTRATDRPLDVNDHIINFLECEEVAVKNSAGTETTILRPRETPLTAGQVVASLKLQRDFNDFMKRHGQQIQPLDCGDNEINTYQGVIWRHPRVKHFTHAAKLFNDAYVAKGRMIGANDPPPSPTEWIAYLVDNAADPKRGARLDSPWPLLLYVVTNRIPLREAEFVWDEKSRGINPMRYIEYIGSLAQAGGNLITLRRLQPFAFTYNSYPGKRLYGGVCGSHTHTAMVAGTTLGQTMIACSSPGHSFPGSIARDKNGVFAFGGGNSSNPWFFGTGPREGTGNDTLKFRSLAWAMNHGLPGYADTHLAWTLEQSLPPDLRSAHGPGLLASALHLNPYNISLARAARDAIQSPADQLRFYQNLQALLATATKTPGCPDGEYRVEFETHLLASLAKLPVPANPGEIALIATHLQNRGDATWARYEIALRGLDHLTGRIAGDLETSIASARTEAGAALLAHRITSTGNAIPDAAAKRKWAETLLGTLTGKERYAPDPKKPAATALDPAFTAAHGLRALGMGLPAAKAELEQNLLSAARRDLLAARLNTVAEYLPNPKERGEWGKRLLSLVGNRLTGDPCEPVIYRMGVDLAAVQAKLIADIQAGVARGRTGAEAETLWQRATALRSTLDKNKAAAFETAVLDALKNHEFFRPDPANPSVMKLDPAIRGTLLRAKKETLHFWLNDILANGQSPESSAALSEYLLGVWHEMRWQVPQQQELAKALLATLRGRALYAPDPAKPGDVRFDDFLRTIYHNFGRTPHGQGGIYTSEDDLTVCADTLARLYAIPRADASALAMKHYVECLTGRLNGNQRKPWGVRLLPLVKGREYRAVVSADGKKTFVPDECAVYIHQLAGQKLPPPPKE